MVSNSVISGHKAAGRAVMTSGPRSGTGKQRDVSRSKSRDAKMAKLGTYEPARAPAWTQRVVGGKGASCAFLNGAKGEYTGTDGVRRKNRPAAQLRKAVQATRRVAGRLANNYVRQATGVNLSKLARQPTVRAPAVAAQKQVTHTANIVRTGDSIRIRHREFVGNVAGSVAYSVVGDYDLNPGNSRLMPWLATQATSWEKYMFHNITFEYITRCSTSTAGSVLMLPIYDSKETTPGDEASATTFANAVEDAPWKDIDCRLDSRKLSKVLYVRNAITAGDIRTSDVARFIVAVVGMADGAGVGKLWISYDVSLSAPVTIPATPHCTALTQWFNSAEQTYAGGDLQHGAMVHDGLKIGRYQTGNATEIFLPAGSFRISLQYRSRRLAAGNNAIEVRVNENDQVGWITYPTVIPALFTCGTSYEAKNLFFIYMGPAVRMVVRLIQDVGGLVDDYSLTVEAA